MRSDTETLWFASTAPEAVDGGTRLTFSLEAAVGGVKGLLMGRAVQSSMDAEMGALDRLKAVLEAGG